LKWSQYLNEEQNYDLMRVQGARVDKLERELDEDPDGCRSGMAIVSH